MLFQSTHPCGVRPCYLMALNQSTSFQSTHPCGVRRRIEMSLTDEVVSIHAPVWGATITKFFEFTNPKVSIHAPVWGATVSQSEVTRVAGFNPRTRVGCDMSIPVRGNAGGWFQSTHPCGVRPACTDEPTFGDVSIHAPVWGATCNLSLLNLSACFNPRTRVGCDLSQCPP